LKMQGPVSPKNGRRFGKQNTLSYYTLGFFIGQNRQKLEQFRNKS